MNKTRRRTYSPSYYCNNQYLVDFPVNVFSFLHHGVSFHKLPLSKKEKTMRRSSRRNSVIAEKHVSASVDLDATSTDDTTNTSKWWCTFASFLTEASSALVPDSPSALSDAYFYLIQSTGWKSLCLLTGLDVNDYCALLIKCKLVRVRKHKDGSRLVNLEWALWDSF